MARYVVHVRSPRSPTDTFAYMADLSNFAERDPGVERAEPVDGDGPGPDTAYDAQLTLNGLLGVLDRVLGLGFKRIGDKAATGLIRALDGERVADPGP